MTMADAFIEIAPAEILAKIGTEKPGDEDVIVQISTDLEDDYTFGEQWLVRPSQCANSG